MTLDIIGKAVFNYDYNALTTDSPVIQARAAGGADRNRPGSGAGADTKRSGSGQADREQTGRGWGQDGGLVGSG